MAKKHKVAEDVAAETALEVTRQAETSTEDVAAVDLVVAKEWKPGSCINCGETTTDAVQVIAIERFRCTRCKHEWTLAEEQAPFRRLARR